MKIVAVSNCHGGRVVHYLSLILKSILTEEIKYKYKFIYNGGYIDKDISLEEKSEIKDADILLLQYIQSDIKKRKYIHHDTIIKLAKNNCKIILIPFVHNIDLYMFEEINKYTNLEKFNKDFDINKFNINYDDSINKIHKQCENCSFDISQVIKKMVKIFNIFVVNIWIQRLIILLTVHY